VYLQTYAFQHHAVWAQKVDLFLSLMESQVQLVDLFTWFDL
jgi:hypothetical protein